ncbi:hypothetical protein HMPREF0380_00869 [Eubacterium infirmum F0142]|nr:hypothetical protein HMPREF0380_00869 [Eubacterium infirmum F0142]
MFITLHKIQKMSEEGIDCIRINGNTIITKKAYDFATSNDIDLIAVKDPIISKKRMDVMKDPAFKLSKLLRKIRSKY